MQRSVTGLLVSCCRSRNQWTYNLGCKLSCSSPDRWLPEQIPQIWSKKQALYRGLAQRALSFRKFWSPGLPRSNPPTYRCWKEKGHHASGAWSYQSPFHWWEQHRESLGGLPVHHSEMCNSTRSRHYGLWQEANLFYRLLDIHLLGTGRSVWCTRWHWMRMRCFTLSVKIGRRVKLNKDVAS